MSLTRIDLRSGKSATYLAELRDVISETLTDILDIPEDDRHEVLTEHDPEKVSISPSFLGAERSEDAILIQITLNDRFSREQKQSFFWSLAKNLDEEVLIRPGDVIVSLVEVDRDSWSFGDGRAQLAEGEKPG